MLSFLLSARSLAIMVMVMAASACTYVSGDAVRNSQARSGQVIAPPNTATVMAQGGMISMPEPMMDKAEGESFVLIPPRPGSPTGTDVGLKTETLRQDLQRLQDATSANSQILQSIRAETADRAVGYHQAVAQINSRLQVGTTPGNPILVNQWNEAQLQLDRLSEVIGRLNNLSSLVAQNSSTANYLLEATNAALGLSGAVDEDHRQLRILQDDVNRTIVVIQRLLKDLSDEIARQTAYISSERTNLTTLALAIKNGELYGASLSNRVMNAVPPAPIRAVEGYQPLMPGAMETPLLSDLGKPLVVIRFDRANVSYERQLYNAVSRALERRPDASFTLITVSPARPNPAAEALGTSQARKNADNVMRSLADMGLPATRVTLSSRTDPGVDVNEIQLFVR